jgi:hypothetical protein
MADINIINFNKPNYIPADLLVRYVDSLKLIIPIDVSEVDCGPNDYTLAWTQSDSEVFIVKSYDLEKYEKRLAHELTHISLKNEGYRPTKCYSNDSESEFLANALHHLILYPRMAKYYFNTNEDCTLAIRAKKETINDFVALFNRDPEAMPYIVLTIIEDIIRIDPVNINDYQTIVKPLLSDCYFTAEQILTYINQHGGTNIDIPKYIKIKEYIETKLGMNYHDWR